MEKQQREAAFSEIYEMVKPYGLNFSYGGLFGRGRTKAWIETAPAFASQDKFDYGRFLELRTEFPYSHAFDFLEMKVNGDILSEQILASLTPLKGLGFCTGLNLGKISRLEKTLGLPQGAIRDKLTSGLGRMNTDYFIATASYLLASKTENVEDKEMLKRIIQATLRKSFASIKAGRAGLIEKTKEFEINDFIESFRAWMDGGEA